MISYLGNFTEDATVYIMFNTFTSNDPSASCTITNFVNTDVHIHKDDGLTQRNNAAGITVSVDFDGITGSHMVKIDTSDNTVAGFWVVGHEYFVRIEGTTIDGATINSVVGQFSIENRYNEVDVVKWLGQACAAATVNGVPEVDVTHLAGVAQSLTDLKDFADNCFNTVSKRVDTNVQTILGDGTTPTNLADLVDTGYNSTTHKIQGVVLADTVATNSDMRGTDSAALAIALSTHDGKLDTVDSLVDTLISRLTAARAGYLDNLSAGAVALDSGVDLTKIHGVALTETVDGYLAAAFTKLFDVVTPLLVASDVMRGTDSAALAATALTDVTWTDAKAAFIDASIAAIPTTAMRGTDNAALAATALSDAVWTDVKAAFLNHSIATVDTVVDGIQSDLDNATDGLGALKALIDTIDGIVDNILLDTGTDGVLLDAAATSAQLISDNWDEILTGATHNIATSAGKRVREIGAYAIHSGTAQAGDSVHITLTATASATDGLYNRNLLVLIDGTGANQTRTVIDYDGATKVATIDREWRINPDATTEYQIVADDTPLVVDQGVAQEGTVSTIKLREYASSTDNIYLCNIVTIVAGTGRGQARLVSAYNGTTKVVTICGENWITTPDNTSVYVMMPYGTTCVSCVGDDALAQIVAANIAGISDGSYDQQEMMRIMFAALSGKSSGGGTATLAFRDAADSKDRISETVDASGNRTAVTRDGT